MREIYNKSALDMISSRDQLDKAVRLATPATWTSIIAAILIIAGLLSWGFLGEVPQEVDATGVYLEEDDFFDEFSSIEGVVTVAEFSEGDIISKGDLLVSTSTDDDYYKLKQLDERIAYVENITFDSDFDYVTNDTEPLASIKTKVAGATIDSESTNASLELKKKRLAELQSELADKEQKLLVQKEAYFSTLPISDKSAQIKYSEANATYDTHSSKYESAKQNYISAKEEYFALENGFNKQYEYYNADESTEEEIEARDAALQQVQDAANKVADLKHFMEEAASALEKADSELAAARKDYLEKDNAESGVQAENTMSQNEYSEALNSYNTTLAEVKSMRDQVDELELKSVVDESHVEVNLEVYKQEFDNKKSSILYELRNKREDLLNEINTTNVYATHNGIVKDVMIKEGMAIQKGTKILTLSCSDRILDASLSEANTVYCYVKLADARKLREDMTAHIFPSTVTKQEYGHITGKVVRVHKSVASKENIQEVTGSDALTETFYKQGPSVQVEIKLDLDPTTRSGYSWSTEKGSSVELEGTTLVDVSVEESHERPIDLLITGIKEKLEFKQKTKETE